ncbi:hypothetical protein [uncultured Aquimarina sp.]|uniref:hypothetical protein n=1 Tax=uncultured Aquimarina sp. TaxID=575652 RepID=UPI002629A080|nr:hypothetical protein [uncultured Aquimarina sp.]
MNFILIILLSILSCKSTDKKNEDTIPDFMELKDDFFCFDQISINKSFQIEKKLNSKEYTPPFEMSVSDDYFPNADKFNLAQPKVFNRTKANSIPIQVHYYYTKEDNVVRLITYDWDTKNSMESIDDLLKKENDQSGKFDDYNKKFDEISKIISKHLSKPEPNQGKIIKKKEEGYGEWLERKIVWQTEKCNTELIMIWTEGADEFGTYQITTKIYWN